MSEIAIRVENLGKQYRIGSKQERYRTLRDALVDAAAAPFRRLASVVRGQSSAAMNEVIWALKDVSFEVKRGEAVGIIGRNGAGKSTLLKILSRITEPTTGWAEIHGRVGSLLEVGTGFHPELTGRDNIYLNGTILGMKRTEIEKKFDEIVAFAEVEKFIDTPVKHYSSGMYVRLAFAVAAYLEPEILLVDEVLAVGDAAFQKKCLGKMENVAKEGRTVLFVSHNMGTVQMLCCRGVLLNNGIVVLNDDIERVIADYLRDMEVKSLCKLADRRDRGGKGEAKLIDLDILANRTGSTVLAAGSFARFVFHVDSMCPGMSCHFTVYNSLGYQVANFDSAVHGLEDIHDVQLGTKFICDIEELNLVPGRYRINAALFSGGEMQDHVEAVAVFDVEQGVIRGRPINKPIGHGSAYLPHRWYTPA
jgi:lipopolysaccharide transport system ATP-binding protein